MKLRIFEDKDFYVGPYGINEFKPLDKMTIETPYVYYSKYGTGKGYKLRYDIMHGLVYKEFRKHNYDGTDKEYFDWVQNNKDIVYKIFEQEIKELEYIKY